MDYPPFFEGPPGLLNKPDGSVLFECLCNGNPQPQIQWFFKDQEIKDDDRHKMGIKKKVGKYAVTLVIKSPTQSDQGIYKVVAKNAKGQHETQQNYVMICTADAVYKFITSVRLEFTRETDMNGGTNRAASFSLTAARLHGFVELRYPIFAPCPLGLKNIEI